MQNEAEHVEDQISESDPDEKCEDESNDPFETHDEIADDPADADFEERQSAALAALDAAITANSVMIYRSEDLQRAIRELEDDGESDDFFGPDDEKPRPQQPDLSSEDRSRLKVLRRISNGRLGPRRRLLLGSDRMRDRVEAIKTEAPHFAPILDVVWRAVVVSIDTGASLRLPPMLLVGAPGIGKTYVLKKIAAALDCAFELFPMNMLDSFRLRGLNTTWRGARMGKIAETLLASPTACPLILLDEFEKAPQLSRFEQPYDIFHTLFETENSEAFVDDFLEVPMRADHVIWIGSANATAGLPDSIVDRMLVLQIPQPTREQLTRIVDGIYATVRGHYDSHFAERLSGEVRDALAAYNPRQLKRIVDLALGFAATAGRDALAIADVEKAIRLAGDAVRRYPIGFFGQGG